VTNGLGSETSGQITLAADGCQITRSLAVDVAQSTCVIRVGQVEQLVTEVTQRVFGGQM